MTHEEPRRAPPAAGAMTLAMHAASHPESRHALRIGIVRGGKILHDRVLSEYGVVSLGTAEHNSFVVAGASLPKRFDLLQIDASGFRLRFSPAMSGRVSLDGEALELSTLVQTGRASTHEGAFVLQLSEEARGKLAIGDVTILFERVMAQPLSSRPQLPMTRRSNFSKSIDWLFTGFVVTSFLTHFTFVAYMENADRPIEDVRERVRSAQLLMEGFDPPPPDPVDPPLVPPSQRDENQADPRQAKGQKPPTTPSDGHAGPATPSNSSKPADSKQFVADARREVENLLLGAAGLGSNSAFVDLLRDGAVTTDADELFAAAQGSTIAMQASAGLINTRQIEEGTRTHGLGSLLPGRHETGPVSDGAPIRENEIRANIEPGQIEEEGGTGELDAAEVTREIKKRLGAIRTCYEHALRRDAGLNGKLTVRFTVEQSGSLSHVAVLEDSLKDSGLSKCVTGAISSMRMRNAPEGGSVDFSYPFVFRGEK